MRAHHILAVIVVLVIGVGAKQFLFPAEKAEADIQAAGLDIRKMHGEIDMKSLPEQNLHDMALVFEGN